MFLPEPERRRADRQRWIVDIFFDGAESTGIAQTRDISLFGLYMSTRQNLPKGARLKIRLPIDPDKSQYLVADADVAYSQAGVGVGLEFVGMTEADQILLEYFLTESKKAFVAAGGILGDE
ncbi:MAG: PilZ domain-containing protein [Blastocatellia bacterium]